MTTYLQLCQRVRYECGLAGTGDVPASVLNQTGVMRKVVDRTQRAWVDIQTARPYWKFMRKQKVYALTINQRTYSVASDLSVSDLDKWDRESSCIYDDSTADETQLAWIDYQDFRRRFHDFTQTGRPCILTDKVKDSIQFDITPDEAYTVTLDYWKTPVVLAANDDVPDIPMQHQDVIVWKSVLMFAGNEISPELLAYATRMYTQAFFNLVVDQGDLPTARRSYPLAQGRRTNPVPGFGWR